MAKAKVDDTWKELETLIKSSKNLGKPATAASIRDLKDRLGFAIPESYLASLRRHDGAADLDGYELFSIEKARSERSDLLKQLHGDAFAGREPSPAVLSSKQIDHVWWNAAWVPFASRGSSRLQFLDMDPWQHGTEGQVLEWDAKKGPLEVTHNSFEDWLQARLESIREAN